MNCESKLCGFSRILAARKCDINYRYSMAIERNMDGRELQEFVNNFHRLKLVYNTTINLGQIIQTVNALNIDVAASSLSSKQLLSSCIDDDLYLLSDADAEMLLLIEFEDIVNLDNITFYGRQATQQTLSEMDIEASPPKFIHIFKTDDINNNFSHFDSIKPDVSIECKPKKLNKGQKIKLQKQAKYVGRFRGIKCLAIYIKTNQNDTELTYLSGLKVEGKIMKPNHHQAIVTLEHNQYNSKQPEFPGMTYVSRLMCRILCARITIMEYS